MRNRYKTILSILLLLMAIPCFADTEDLHEAVKKNDLKLIRKILDKNPKAVNLRENVAGFTALHIASHRGYKDAVILLISKGAAVNKQDTAWGFTPLHLAKSKSVASILVMKGAKIETKDKYGGTPLFAAVTNHHTDVVSFLISKGADLNAETSYGVTPLKKAVMSNFQDIIEILKKHGAKE
jgi:ankyrin repeat protein